MRHRHKKLWATTLICTFFLHSLTLANPVLVPQFLSGGTGRNIRHLPCVSRRTGETGVCMFAFTCAKANGTHLGTCIDRFYFGSCCKIDDEPNVLPQDNAIEEEILLGSSKPFITSTTPHGLESNVIPDNIDSISKPAGTRFPIHGSTLITKAPESTTLKTVDQTKTPKPIKVVSKKPIAISTTTESIRLSTFQTVQTGSEQKTSTTPGIISSKPHSSPSPSTLPFGHRNVTSKRPGSTIYGTRRPITTLGVTDEPDTIGTTMYGPGFTVESNDVNQPSTYTSSSSHYSRPTTISSTTQKAPSPTRFPPRNTTNSIPTFASATNVTSTTSQEVHKPLTTRKPSKKPTKATTKRPIATRRPTTTPATRQPPTFVFRPTSGSTGTKLTTPIKRPSTIVSKKNFTSTIENRPTTTAFSKFTVTTRKPVISTIPQLPETTKLPTSEAINKYTTQKLQNSTTVSLLTTREPIDYNVVTESTVITPVSLTSSVTQGGITRPAFQPRPSSPSTSMFTNKKNVTSWSRPTSTTESNEIDTEIDSETDALTATSGFVTWSSFSVETENPTKTPEYSSIVPASTYVDTLSTIASVTVAPEFTDATLPPINMSNFRDVCGRRLYSEPRIVNGTPSSFGKWPWQISLRQWRTSTYLHKCGAALLNENWAITAAHCVQNVPPGDLLLRIGEHDLSHEDEPYGFQERRVQIVASHPQFDARTFEFDLALMRFYEPVLPFQPNILPVCVPDDDEDFVGQHAVVTGWGRLYDEGPLPPVLQEVSVPVINNTACEDMYRHAGYIEHIPHIFICAGWRKGGFDSCEGDSGGPLVVQRKRDNRWVLAGVISWGIGCAEPNQPGVYTRISEFREWINKILQF
ncbi:hypothetical protein QAD02_022980 [Eretmocerus hayati]|uniref:Uncharacterized protein n=1 Tax=Eretmocerus hayati TaxID=131215 RepID=A0ACC2PUH6_9HYME|nr:hypothetical protein QAD02_022980 [Eretmocerus hayati]